MTWSNQIWQRSLQFRRRSITRHSSSAAGPLSWSWPAWSLISVSGYPAAGQAATQAADDIQFARAILQEHAQVSDRVLAIYVLGNADVAADQSDTTTIDNAIRWQLNNVSWSELREIG